MLLGERNVWVKVRVTGKHYQCQIIYFLSISLLDALCFRLIIKTKLY